MKNMKLYHKRLLLALVFSIAIITFLGSCKRIVYAIVTVDNGLNITPYLESNPSQFSLFDAILVRTGYDGFLGAYGGYTLFAPNNDAVNLYLKQRGKASVNDINIDTLKQLVLYHVIKDTLGTAGFKDGKIPTPTMQGQFLFVGVNNVNGTSSFAINNGQALITQSNIKCANGVVHVIDHVLTAATKTLAQLIEADPNNYSFFLAALKATGFYDVLNVLPAANPNTPYLTVLAVPNSAYIKDNINSAAQLIAKYSKSGNPKSPTDSLYLYCAYHILPENAYLTDIISTSSHKTLAPSEIITDQLIGTDILLNQITFNNILEPGAPINRAASNITALNGVLNAVTQNFGIKVRTIQPLYWDLGDLPEFRANTAVWRKPGKSFGTTALGSPEAVHTTITGITFGTVGYGCELNTATSHYYWADYLTLLSFRNSTGALNSEMMFHTPPIVKGRYKVWFTYNSRSGLNAGAQFFFEGGDGVEQALQNVIPTFAASTSGIPTAYNNDSESVLEAKGYKRYNVAAVTDADYTYNPCVLLGVVNVYTNDRHYLRMKAIGGANNPVSGVTLNLDMIHFIPVDQVQTQPRFLSDGTTKVIHY